MRPSRVWAFGMTIGIAACKAREVAPIVDAGTSEASAVGSLPAASSPTPASSTQGSAVEARARQVAEVWSRALDAHDEAALAKVYASKVELYGKELPRDAAVRAKREAFARTPSFTQSIADLRVAPSSHDEGWVVRFTKTSGAKGKTSSVDALLALKFEGGALRVFRESDAPTEAKRGGDLEECRADGDCRNGKLCIFVAGATWVCSAPPKPETCPGGQIFLPRVGGCWTPCKTDHDCEDGTWCRVDPNAPESICMAHL